MHIDGPVTVGVIEAADGGAPMLELRFTPAFRALGLAEQGEALAAYLTTLAGAVQALPTEDRNRQGMLLIQQILQELQPHIVAGEMALGEPIQVALGGGAEAAAEPSLDVFDLLRSQSH